MVAVEGGGLSSSRNVFYGMKRQREEKGPQMILRQDSLRRIILKIRAREETEAKVGKQRQ